MYIRYVLCFLATPLSDPATIVADRFCAAAGELSAETVHHDFVLIWSNYWGEGGQLMTTTTWNQREEKRIEVQQIATLLDRHKWSTFYAASYLGFAFPNFL
jgi:hypothetical protein